MFTSLQIFSNIYKNFNKGMIKKRARTSLVFYGRNPQTISAILEIVINTSPKSQI